MKKKIFIGSIVAVVILVLVSFTGVVGYSNVKSNVKASPLFNIRTNRAIGEESKVLTAKYVGKGITLPFPERDDKTIMVQKVVDSIRIMGDKAFERFIASVIDSLQKNNRFNGIKPDIIREALYLLKDSDEPIPILEGYPTVGGSRSCKCTFGHGSLGIRNCIRDLFFYIILLPIAVFIVICSIFRVIPTST